VSQPECSMPSPLDSPPPTRVLIVEDEPEFLRHFTQAVLADPALSLEAAVASGAAALAVLSATEPDVVLLDLGLPDIDGMEVIRHVARTCPQCDVLVVTMFGDDQHVFEALESGATGYLLKDFALERIAASIHEVRAGGSPISPSIARSVLKRMRATQDAVPADSPAGAPAQALQTDRVLTPREIELLKLTAKGLSFERVGELMGISPHTVVAHVKNIYRKLAVHSRGEAVFEATQLGLL
jgi:DNA-binding NarL/FixJ family response regulator